MRKTIVVVGGGLGGVAAALRLARAGHAVEVWEKNAAPGGKLQERRDAGFRWDTGPSLLTMPHVVRDLFDAAGEKMEDHLALEPLPLTCRYSWRDGTVIDEDAAFWKRPDTARFLAHAKGIYDLSGEAYLNYPPAEFWRAFTLRNVARLRHLPKVATLRTLAREDARRFADPHVRQIFDRFATYNGSSPYRTPATFAIIPYVEATFGGWYVRGGMARLAEAAVRLAEKAGVVFRCGTEAASWEHGVLESADGRKARPDVVVCNQDVLAAARTWLASRYSKRELATLLRPELSTSGFVVLLGTTKTFPRLAHHNIFFSADYPAEFADLFDRKRLPADPTLYVAATCRTDPADAPPGGDNLFVLANAPAVPPESLSDGQIAAYADHVVARLEAAGLEGLSGNIAVRHAFSPREFAARDGSRHGALYGWASHSLRASLLRPPLWRGRDLYFVGGTTHPGGGIPLVLLSANMVATRIGTA